MTVTKTKQIYLNSLQYHCQENHTNELVDYLLLCFIFMTVFLWNDIYLFIKDMVIVYESLFIF